MDGAQTHNYKSSSGSPNSHILPVNKTHLIFRGFEFEMLQNGTALSAACEKPYYCTRGFEKTGACCVKLPSADASGGVVRHGQETYMSIAPSD